MTKTYTPDSHREREDREVREESVTEDPVPPDAPVPPGGNTPGVLPPSAPITDNERAIEKE